MFENIEHKTGVINDPLGLPTNPLGCDCRLILKFWDGRTICVKIVITTGRDCGRPRGSIFLVRAWLVKNCPFFKNSSYITATTQVENRLPFLFSKKQLFSFSFNSKLLFRTYKIKFRHEILRLKIFICAYKMLDFPFSSFALLKILSENLQLCLSRPGQARGVDVNERTVTAHFYSLL